jgi:hydrogenase expression/formation protein HypC
VCLGIPGQIVELPDEHEHLAGVDVAGVRRVVNVGLLTDEVLEVGNWILIHVGFALSSITEEEAAMALASLEMMGESFDGDVSALVGSGVADDLGGADPFSVSDDPALATEP